MLSLVLIVTMAAGPEYRASADAGVVRVTTPSGEVQVVTPPCPARAALAHEARLYVACGLRGVVVYGLSDEQAPRLQGMQDLGAEVVGFHVAAEQVWIELRRLEARPAGELALVPPSIAPAPPEGPAPAPDQAKPAAGPGRVGQVVEERSGGAVVIDLGSAQGLRAGDRIAILERREVVLAPGEEPTLEERLIAIGEVTTVSAGHAEVRLGLNERVPLPAVARPTTEEVTASRWSPPRAGDQWAVAFTLRPFLAIGALGVGTISDAFVGYRFQRPLHLQFVIEPLGVGLADAGNLFVSAGNVIFSYDKAMFEVGLGAGWSAVNDDLQTQQPIGDGTDGTDRAPDNVYYGLSIAQLARLGAADGLHLLVRNTFVLYDDEFHYGGTIGQVVIPVVERSAVFARGGGGQAGFAFGEVGLRTLLTGNGLHDSIFVNASLGGGGLFGELEARARRCLPTLSPDHYLAANGQCYETVDYAGPLIGLGIEWRP